MLAAARYLENEKVPEGIFIAYVPKQAMGTNQEVRIIFSKFTSKQPGPRMIWPIEVPILEEDAAGEGSQGARPVPSRNRPP